MASKLIVKAGEHDRENSPVSLGIDTGILGCSVVALQPEAGGEPIACQLVPDGDRQRLFFILPGLKAHSEAVYVLVRGESASGASGVELNAQVAGQIEVRICGEFFSSFHHSEQWARPFLHPLIGPYGDPVTRAYPVQSDVPGETQDHPHHKSFWVAWGDVNGTDNWSESEQHGFGRQIVSCMDEILAGSVFGRLSMTNHWVSEKGQKVLEEDRRIAFWNVPKAGRLVDLSVTFRATEGPVRFGDTKEGGICSIRVATSMDAKDAGTIVNSYGGTNEAETWGKRAHWCDYYGPVNGRTVGIAIFDHPANFRYPTYWHVRNYGLMTANPFGLSHFLADKTVDGSHTMAAGSELTFRYRVYIHAGDTVQAGVAGKFLDFVQPPAAAIQ